MNAITTLPPINNELGEVEDGMARAQELADWLGNTEISLVFKKGVWRTTDTTLHNRITDRSPPFPRPKMAVEWLVRRLEQAKARCEAEILP